VPLQGTNKCINIWFDALTFVQSIDEIENKMLRMLLAAAQLPPLDPPALGSNGRCSAIQTMAVLNGNHSLRVFLMAKIIKEVIFFYLINLYLIFFLKIKTKSGITRIRGVRRGAHRARRLRRAPLPGQHGRNDARYRAERSDAYPRRLLRPQPTICGSRGIPPVRRLVVVIGEAPQRGALQGTSISL